MNAVTVSRHAASKEYAMPTHEDSGQGAESGDQLGQLRSDVRYLQCDVTDLKSEVRATHQRIDALRDKTDEKLTHLDTKFDEKLTAVDKKLDEKFLGVSKDITALGAKVDAAKLWAVLLFISMFCSLFVVIARAFKWL